MNTVTDSDIKEIKEAISTLAKQLNDVEKNLTAKINDVEKNLATNNAKIDGIDKRITDGLNNLDKRITTQEFIYRAVFIAIISLFTTGAITTVGTSAIKYFWNNPLFPI